MSAATFLVVLFYCVSALKATTHSVFDAFFGEQIIVAELHLDLEQLEARKEAAGYVGCFFRSLGSGFTPAKIKGLAYLN